MDSRKISASGDTAWSAKAEAATTSVLFRRQSVEGAGRAIADVSDHQVMPIPQLVFQPAEPIALRRSDANLQDDGHQSDNDPQDNGNSDGDQDARARNQS